MFNKRKFLVYGAIMLVIWFLVSRPAQAADMIHGALGLMGDALDRFGTFLSALTR